uniref:Uncharacterized protein n=1 Tax=Romanomermis culicivorax TaxID=13658 RepID=A0A915JQH6_ROMCU
MVVAVVDVRTVGSSDVAVGGSEVEDDVAGSMSIRGGGGSEALNTAFRGFFNASMCLWITASRCKELM